jgi:hypothetical protein
MMTRRQFAAILAAGLNANAATRKTRNILFVMADGLRWQEVFGGADEALISKENGVSDADAFRREFWRDSAAERRRLLMPFLWSTVAVSGQLYGNRNAGSDCYVTNGHNFSYPGYSEIFCGFADARVDSNDKKLNPNQNVLEWLHRKPAYQGKVAAFGAWDLFPYILNAERSGFPVNAGYEPMTLLPMNPKLELLNRLKIETGMWDGEPFDAPAFLSACEYFKARKPRVLYLSLGETDEWAHAGKYELYLRSARRTDRYVRELWEMAQSMREYRDSTTLILAVDHGRGGAPVEWKSHGEKVPESKYTWAAYLGPDTPAKGERKNVEAVTQSQIAATLAALLGEDYCAAVPKAGKPVKDVV